MNWQSLTSGLSAATCRDTLAGWCRLRLPRRYFPHNLFAFEPDPAVCKSNLRRQQINHTWGYTLGNSGFVVQNLWRRYKHQPDREYLEQTAYPAVRNMALFYADFIEKCQRDANGKAIVAPTVSPEHWQWTRHFKRNRNCTYDLAFMRHTFAAAIEGAGVLGATATSWRTSGRRPNNCRRIPSTATPKRWSWTCKVPPPA